MTLSVATPGPDPITVLENGIQIIRCAEYVGAARGTLSTVSDPLSVAGTVVKDEQSIAPPSTTASVTGSLFQSVTIPFADITMPPDSSYTMFLGLRSEGSTPTNGRYGEFWNYYFSTVGPSVAVGRDGSLSTFNARVPTAIFEHYSLLGIGGMSPGFASGHTDFDIAAWGLDNISDPLAWYLDVIYMIPFALADTDESNGQSFGAFSYFLPQPFVEPSWPATDEVPIDVGQYSVLEQFADGVFGSGTGMDIQEADDENTECDWHEIFFDEPERTTSWITIVGAGSRLIKPQTIDSLDFSDTTSTPTWGYYVSPNYYVLTGTGSSIDGEGWAGVDGGWRLLTSSTTPPSGHNFYYYWALGQSRGLPVGFSSSDPRTYAHVMGNLESFILTMKCTLDDGFPTGADAQFVAGAVRYTPAVPRYGHGLVLRLKTGGTVEASLMSRYTNNESAYSLMENSGAGPTTVLGGLGAGDSFWLKAERRYYNWRAKVWLDGDPEPGSWLLEAHEPVIFSSSPPLQYPYLTGWTGGASNENFPVTMPIDSVTFGSPWTPGGEMVSLDGTTSTNWHFSVNSIEVEYDPDPEPGGAGSYTGAYFRIEKFDGSVDWGSAYVPPGALQVLYSDYAPHHFDGTVDWGTDVHGGNFSAWKETGGKLLQAAAYSQFYFRRPARVPQWGDVKFP